MLRNNLLHTAYYNYCDPMGKVSSNKLPLLLREVGLAPEALYSAFGKNINDSFVLELNDFMIWCNYALNCATLQNFFLAPPFLNATKTSTSELLMQYSINYGSQMKAVLG